MSWLEVWAILITGFVGCAEFGSAALVHPVIRQLAPNDQLTFEKGLLKTFGRIMPLAMTAATALGVSLAIQTPSGWLIAAAAVLSVALVVTIGGNVPINIKTGRIHHNTAPAGFIAMRRKWDVFQLIRATLQLCGFAFITVGIAVA